MIDIVGKRYWFFGISLLVIIPGMLALILWGLPLGIDFSGGSLLELRFPSGGTLPSTETLVGLYADAGVADATVQSVGTDGLLIRSKTMEDAVKGEIVASLTERTSAEVVVQRFESVGPAVGAEVAQRAALAVGLAALGIMLYISYAFRRVEHAFRYGVAAIMAMLHDVLVVIGVEAILGHFLGWEADSLFLTALLTVIGFSVHDTIVVFDRIRENRRLHRRLSYETLVNHSIVQTLDRSINTQLTVMFTLLGLLLFGGATTHRFVTILLIGVFSGTYSSIFNAAQILVVWENQEWRTWFRGRRASTATS
jgi:preprotein translocase subunit SecF